MRRPTIAPGSVEQAIYTWSSFNLDTSPGRGFGAATPALRACVPWLSALKVERFKLFDATLSNSSHAHENWERHRTVGSFQHDGLSLVFRKMAGAEDDGAGRTRWVAHVLVGHADELDLAAVGDDADVWLDAADCPLDRLPTLEPIETARLAPRRMQHACAELDARARDLLRQLPANGDTLVLGREAPVTPDEVTTTLLAAVPTPLWPSIELAWFAGEHGPVAHIAIGDGGASGSARERLARTDLAACELHAAVDEAWMQMPAKRRTWAHFHEAFRAHARRTIAKPPATPSAPTAAPAEQLPAERAAQAVRTAIGDASWSFDRTLEDAEARSAANAIAALEPPPRGWIAVLGVEQLQALLAGADSSATFDAAARLCREASTARLAHAWRATSLAAIGLALLARDSREGLSGRWALPKHVDPQQLQRLLQPFARRGDAGVNQVVELVHGGFGATQTGRHALVEAALASGFNAQRIFKVILLRAGLPPEVLLEFMRDSPDAAATGLELPGPYRTALRLGLGRRRWRSLAQLPAAIRRRDEDERTGAR